MRYFHEYTIVDAPCTVYAPRPKEWMTTKGKLKMQYNNDTRLMAQQNQYNVENAATAQGYTQDNMKLSSQLAINNWQTQFNAQNAYNDPTAQRARLQAAGYNPFLAIGEVAGGATAANPSAATGSAPSGPMASQSGFPGTNIGYGGENLLQALEAAEKISNQVREWNLTPSQIKGVKAAARRDAAAAANDELDNKIRNMPYKNENGETQINPTTGKEYTIGEVQGQAQTDQILQTVHNLAAEANKNGWNAMTQKLEYKKLAETYPEAVDALRESYQNVHRQGKVLDKQADQLEAITENTNAQTQTVNELRPHQIQQIDAATAKLKEETKDIRETRALRKRVMASQANLNDSMTSYYKKNKEYLDAQIDAVYYDIVNRHVNFRATTAAGLDRLRDEGLIDDHEYWQLMNFANAAGSSAVAQESQNDNYTNIMRGNLGRFLTAMGLIFGNPGVQWVGNLTKK